MVQSVAVGKKDVITQKIERGLEWAAAHVQQVALALAAMAVIALLTVYVLHNLRKLRHLAWEQLSSAQALASRGQRDEALRIVRELISTSRSAPLTTQAHLFQGDILILQGETQPAIQSYEEALRQAPIPELEALALAGLALSYEQAQDWRKAEELHQRFIK
jgi:tetratricopeptide (TPR) repeat protein